VNKDYQNRALRDFGSRIVSKTPTNRARQSERSPLSCNTIRWNTELIASASSTRWRC